MASYQALFPQRTPMSPEPSYNHKEELGDYHHQHYAQPSVGRNGSFGPNLEPERNPRLKKMATIALLCIFPLISIVYITFCLIAHYKNVFVDVTNQSQIAVIKSGVTSVAILIIAIALLPLKKLFADLKSEEFFRVLQQKPQGVTLNLVNNVATPSASTGHTLRAIQRGAGSTYLIWTVIGGVCVAAISTLAPAAISISIVEYEQDIQAFQVGAIAHDAVYDTRTEEFVGNDDASANAAASIGWLENLLGVSFGYTSPEKAYPYLVPSPIDLPTNATARWLSDVVVMDPVCEWIAPTSYFNFTSEDSSLNFTFGGVQATSIAKYNTTVKAIADNIPFGTYPGFFAAIDSSKDLVNETVPYPITDGSSFWMLGLCTGTDRECGYDFDTRQVYDFSEIPTTPFTPIPADNANSNNTYNITFLRCNPNAKIVTRAVISRGGVLSVDSEDLSVPQGNLQYWQTQLLMGVAMSPLLPGLSQPLVPTPLDQLGPPAQTVMLVGSETYKKVPPGGFKFGSVDTPSTFLIKPQSIENITAAYANLMRSFTKVYMDGNLGTAFVPGRTTKTVGLITTSMPHVIVSTLLMVFLSAFIIAAHFRARVPQFTFVDVAKSMAGSDVPRQVVVDSQAERDLGERILSIKQRAVLGGPHDEKGGAPIFALS